MPDDPEIEVGEPTVEEKLCDQVAAAIMREIDHALPRLFDRDPAAAKAFVNGKVALLIDRSGVTLVASP
jgi:hypothetical protein